MNVNIKVVCITGTVDYAFKEGEVYSITETQLSVPMNGNFTYYKINNTWFVSAEGDYFYLNKFFIPLSEFRNNRIDEILE